MNFVLLSSAFYLFIFLWLQLKILLFLKSKFMVELCEELWKTSFWLMNYNKHFKYFVYISINNKQMHSSAWQEYAIIVSNVVFGLWFTAQKNMWNPPLVWAAALFTYSASTLLQARTPPHGMENSFGTLR